MILRRLRLDRLLSSQTVSEEAGDFRLCLEAAVAAAWAVAVARAAAAVWAGAAAGAVAVVFCRRYFCRRGSSIPANLGPPNFFCFSFRLCVFSFRRCSSSWGSRGPKK